MESDLRQRLEELLYALSQWESQESRHALLAGILRGHDIWLELDTKGNQKVVANRLLDLCEERASTLLHGQAPVCALLAALRAELATHPRKLAEIDFLTSRLCTRGSGRPRATWTGAPYRGLNHFDREHAPIFFGREAEIQELIKTVTTDQGRRFSVVVGASGSGKSSLVRAGLWARLEQGQVPEIPGSQQWLITAMTPTDMATPLAALRAAVFGATQARGVEDLLDSDWREAVANIDSEDKGSLTRLTELLQRRRPDARWLLILDQMEELFTAVPKDQGAAFIDRLIDATKPPEAGRDPGIQVLATLRADFFHHCLGHPVLKRLVGREGGTFLLGPPARLSLERMISGPLTQVDLQVPDGHGNRVPARWTLDPDLPPAVSADAEQHPGGLALMAFALRELYEHCEPVRHMALETYRSESFGGLSGAIARSADATLEALGEGGEPVLQRVFARLVRVSQDQAPTRRRERRSAWDGDPEAFALVDAFITARLLVADEGAGEEPTVEVAHEALLREWPKLAQWIDQRRDAFRLAERVRIEAQAWIDGDPRWHHRRPWAADVIENMRERLANAGLLDQFLQEDPAVARLLMPEVDWILAELQSDAANHQRRRDIGQRLAAIGDPREGVGVSGGVPDILWRSILGGEVEITEHGRFSVKSFHIAAFPVTFAQFRAFVEAEDGYDNTRRWKDLERKERADAWQNVLANHPVTEVSWYDATAFCRWLSARLKFQVRLPDEQEWQWAAQSARPEFVYPWGPQWGKGPANTHESDINRTTAVGMYPDGDSLQKVSDLAGNVWEWCRNVHKDPTRTGAGGEGSRVVRGGSWVVARDGARAVDRLYYHPYPRYLFVGFRVVCSAPIR